MTDQPTMRPNEGACNPSPAEPLRVTVIDRPQVSSPDSPKGAGLGAVHAVTIGDALTREWPTDAHMTAYEPVSCRFADGTVAPVRLARGALAEGIAVSMALAIGDVDDAEAHASRTPASDAWRAEVEPRLEASGLFWYRTRGGARVVGPLAEPFPIASAADAAAWSARYLAWCDELQARHGLTLDRSCADWTRLYRLPNVLRDGEPQRADLQGGDAPQVVLPAAVAPAPAPAPSPAPPDREPTAGECDQVARAVEAVVPFYAPGERHPLGRALAGYLRHKGLPRAAALDLLDAVASETGSDVAKARDRVAWAYNADHPDGASTLRTRWPALLEELDAIFRDPIVAEMAARRDARAAAAAAAAGDEDRDDDQPAPADPEVEASIACVAAPRAGVYQRGGLLVHVTRDPLEIDGEIIPAGKPTIHAVQTPRLREIIRAEGGRYLEKHAVTVIARQEWRGVRPLDGIASFPVLRPDGSLLLRSGYDSQTRTLATIGTDVADLPGLDAPTRDDARRAHALLVDLVGDFPFDGEQSRAAWVATLCTVLARPALGGPAPLGLFDASERGSGKTLLADLIGVIATGERVARTVAPKTREEWDKSMLAWLMGGAPIVLIDNVTGSLESDALDTVLTGTHFTQRVLGVTEERTVAVRATFIASANNCRISSDLVRRSIRCRIEPGVECPERRTGFRYPRLLAHARAHRAEYLAAALAILRAYAAAGRPPVDARPMGGYEEWASIVRDAVVWSGGADPSETQDDLRDEADDDRERLRALLVTWFDLLGDRPTTAQELCDLAARKLPDDVAAREPVRRGMQAFPPSELSEKGVQLAATIAAMTRRDDGLTTRSAGYVLRACRKRVSGGLVLVPAGTVHDSRTAWKVRQAG